MGGRHYFSKRGAIAHSLILEIEHGARSSMPFKTLESLAAQVAATLDGLGKVDYISKISRGLFSRKLYYCATYLYVKFCNTDTEGPYAHQRVVLFTQPL